MEPDKHDHVLSIAAYAGYRTIGLSYDNTGSVSSFCDTSTCGDNCHGNLREEAILGEDRSPVTVIESADSILERLYNLLVELHLEDMADGTNDLAWDQFYVPLNGGSDLTFDNIVWNKIIISGFSQGAGHAAKIAKEVVVEGLLVIDGANDTCLDGANNPQTADWQLDLVDLSANRPRYFVGHAREQSLPYVAPDGWLALGAGISGTDDLDSVRMTYPPMDAAFTKQERVANSDCTEHNSMARDQCMPTNPISQKTSRKAEKIHLFSELLLRFCFASGSLVP
jgi:hypothetical protein